MVAEASSPNALGSAFSIDEFTGCLRTEAIAELIFDNLVVARVASCIF